MAVTDRKKAVASNDSIEGIISIGKRCDIRDPELACWHLVSGTRQHAFRNIAAEDTRARSIRGKREASSATSCVEKRHPGFDVNRFKNCVK